MKPEWITVRIPNLFGGQLENDLKRSSPVVVNNELAVSLLSVTSNC